MFGNHCDLWQIIERGPTNSRTLKSRWGEKPLQTHIIYIYVYDGKPSTRQHSCVPLPITK